MNIQLVPQMGILCFHFSWTNPETSLSLFWAEGKVLFSAKRAILNIFTQKQQYWSVWVMCKIGTMLLIPVSNQVVGFKSPKFLKLSHINGNTQMKNKMYRLTSHLWKTVTLQRTNFPHEVFNETFWQFIFPLYIVCCPSSANITPSGNIWAVQEAHTWSADIQVISVTSI